LGVPFQLKVLKTSLLETFLPKFFGPINFGKGVDWGPRDLLGQGFKVFNPFFFPFLFSLFFTLSFYSFFFFNRAFPLKEVRPTPKGLGGLWFLNKIPLFRVPFSFFLETGFRKLGVLFTFFGDEKVLG